MVAVIDLRQGRYQSALSDVRCDVMHADPPYSDETHAGHDAGVIAAGDAAGDAARESLDYEFWTPDDVREFVAWATARTEWWLIAQTDEVLAPVYREAIKAAGWLPFATIPWIARRKRHLGDGPPSWMCHIVVGRPRHRRYFNGWHHLVGAYDIPQDRDSGIGGKPRALIMRLLTDYTRRLSDPLVCDPTSGERPTTALACRELGLRFVGAEARPEAHAKAMDLLAQPYTAPLLIDAPDATQEALL